MQLSSEDKKELREFVDKWKARIPDNEIYFSFNGHGHHRYVNANDEGVLRFGIKFVEAAITDDDHIHIAGEYGEDLWIEEQDEDLSIHYIEKVNKHIERFKESRKAPASLTQGCGIDGMVMMLAIIIAPIVFVIYLFIFWLTH